MPQSVRSDWFVIATSGTTADGREIKKDWLTDMAENYDPEFYSAKIWLDHYRFYGSQGEILELKTEKVTEGKLKGEVQLYAIAAPTTELIELNRNGQFHHASIEPIEDFGGKGFTYLGGIGITDYPASLGTTNVHFNNQETSKKFVGCTEVDFSKAVSDSDDDTKFFNRLKQFFKSEQPTTEQGDDMDPKQFSQLLETQRQQATELAASITAAIAEAFKASAPKPAEGEAERTNATAVTAEQFSAQQTAIEDLKTQLGEFSKKLDDAIKNPVPGTNPADPGTGAQEETL